ncbi:hypothetical protein DSCO28_09420 [Desulfosarcina ovata subsp. sediminis]|uniref:Uncharacterized protein n=1 Tax=Desulfosarcina ovata subsp. sediminis TaxID=885957 RepID=A0A5K7ZHB9_9BACT|nr:hypothetical protein [Desulfosarcina ovata]BBO80376.1 hypothetical protein DSCO28_09420 [Desulfosarcina ovata subsp. sediminis]
MSDYQREQLDTLKTVRQGLLRIKAGGRQRLREQIQPYMAFRQTVDRFLQRHFSGICTRTCYDSKTSACCSKDGIITFFADTVVNALNSTAAQLDQLETILRRKNAGHRCVYLGPDGCLWAVRPVVCAMFLCDRAMDTVFEEEPDLKGRWEALRRQERGFKWPDRPVLFDDLEKAFLDLGLRSSLMHLNFSPGLLNVKRKAGLLDPSGGPAVPTA